MSHDAMRRQPVGGRRGVGLALLSLFLFLIPLTGATAQPTQRVIVLLEDGGVPAAQAAERAALDTGGKVVYVYQHAISGFTLEVPAEAVDGLSRRPGVVSVEPDVLVSIAQTSGQPIPTHVDRVEGDANPLSTSLSGIDIAIIDTGVWIGHPDLNLVKVTDCTGAIFYPTFGGCDGFGSTNDNHGHGTHVAGLAAACDNDIGSLGLAPCAAITSIKVLDDSGNGYLGGILAGLDLAAANASWIDVANASWGFEGGSAALDASVSGVIDAGVVFVAAAGNLSQDISTFSPASHPDAITVTALADFDGLPGGLGAATCRSDVDETLADFSNFGAGADIAAPGVCLYSTWLNDGYNTISGTSMAAPVVTGAVARYIAENGKPTNKAGVLAIRDALVNGGFAQTGPCGFDDVADGYPEPLLSINGSAFGGPGGCDSGPTENQTPTASFDFACDGLTCDFASTSTDDGALSYTWDFGGDGTSDLESPSHTFSTTGDFDVTLTVTDDESLTDSATQTITVSAPVPNIAPTASFVADCPDLACTFDASTSSDPDGTVESYAWTFGDDSTATGVQPAHTYTVSGTYAVTLIVTDNDLDDSPIATQSISVSNGTPTAAFTVDCTDLTCDFDASGSIDDGGVVSYSWEFGDGTGDTGQTVSHTYGASGDREVTLTVTDLEDATDVVTHVASPMEPTDAPITTGNAGFWWSDDLDEAWISFLVVPGVEGATLEGAWTVVNKGGKTSTVSASGTTDALGWVTIATTFKKNLTPTEFCVTDITEEGYTYVEGPNPCGGMYSTYGIERLAVRVE